MNEETLNNLSREEAIKLLDSEIEYSYQLKHNWNELKRWLEEYKDGARSGLDSYDWGIEDCLDDVLRKMQEIEEGGNNE